MTDIQKLKALAERVPNDSNIWHAAEERESSNYQGYMVVDNWQCHVASTGMENNDGFTADFIAAANPAAVLELIAEIERLEERNVYWIDQANTIARDRSTVRAERDQLKAESEALRKSLLEASEEVASWGAYASDYFQEKHDLAGCVERFHDAAMSKDVAS